MADWNLPALASGYANFLAYLIARDLDAAQMFNTLPTNPSVNMMAYNRAGNKFQEYDGALWNDKNLAVAGGGTGAGTASGARTNLGLGTIATQDANNVTISGGTISVSTLAGNGASITALNASALASGTVPDARFPSTLPALNGSALTALNASNLASGTVNTARLGSGSANASTFLRGDGTWAGAGMVASKASGSVSPGGTSLTISPSLTDYTKAVVTFGALDANFSVQVTITSNTTVFVGNNDASPHNAIVYMLQGQ